MTPSDDYLKTQTVASALGLSVSTVKRWVDSGTIAAVRTQGKHRLIPRSEAIRLARELNRDPGVIVRLAAMPSCDAGPLDDRLCDRLCLLLSQGDAQEARQLIKSVFASGAGAVRLADELLRPVMARIGHEWMVGALDVYQEHQASQIVISTLLELIGQAGLVASSTAPLALGGTTEGDPYLISSLLAELVLLEAGWFVRNLSVNLPLRSLAQATIHYRPRMVFLSVNYLTDAEQFLREYMSFFETASRMRAAVVVGGQALVPEVRTRLVYTAFGDRMIHLAEFARQLASSVNAAAPAPALSGQPGIPILDASGRPVEDTFHPEPRSGGRKHDE
jgi:MerR family transcriptional regulator, light-induced transcriptional regulator